MVDRALSDLTVVELGHLVSAPFCAKMLADLGAEVIKVEEPGQGDEARWRGPFRDNLPQPEQSGLFLYLNSNKLGITLSLETVQGARMFRELLRAADILVENNSPQTMRSLGLDYESLNELNPRLIVTSITPFGQTGPYRDYRGNDLISFHIGGPGYVTPRAEKHDRPPLKAGGRIADFVAGLNGAIATLCAVYSRELTDRGQHVDVSEQESMVASLVSAIPAQSYQRQMSARLSHTQSAPLHVMACKDGHICIYCSEEYQWRNFVELMGNPAWAEDKRFETRFTRGENWNELEVLLSEWLQEQSKQELFQAAQARRIPFAPVNNMDDLLNSDHLATRGFFTEVEHSKMGRIDCPGAPYKLSDTPWALYRPAPLLGEHNEEIYCKRLGYSKQDLFGMRGMGIV